MNEQALQLKAKMAAEFRSILSFWQQHTPDPVNGGFYGAITDSMEVRKEADRGLVLNARILWTFSTAYRALGDAGYREMADRAYAYLLAHFWDRAHGGWYWMLDYQGNSVQDKKQVYGQAFAIYALTEYHRATGVEEAKQMAIKTFDLLEKYAYDPANKGYFEAFAGDWSPTEELSLSDKDLNEKKSMNTHLHVMEGYTNLLRVWDSAELRKKQGELIDVTIDYIIDPGTAHFLLFFDELWTSKSEHISYGHDIEGSWLLLEAAEVLGDEVRVKRAEEIAIRMAKATLEQGVDSDGGLINEGDAQGYTDTDKDWWPQAEAVVGFLNAYQMTGEDAYFNAAIRSWDFIDRFIVDKENGEWFGKVSRDGIPYRREMKVDPWKCPYHNGRACLEVMERVDKIVSGSAH
ncbi:MAG: AGE family epimerase/isomerase [Gorillibacterium sp.]|nr:AGE family epimerase/isomerase [Gorillibacterium sp.]